jgi:hypothetical protein
MYLREYVGDARNRCCAERTAVPPNQWYVFQHVSPYTRKTSVWEWRIAPLCEEVQVFLDTPSEALVRTAYPSQFPRCSGEMSYICLVPKV